MTNKKNILVIGGAGFIGSHFVDTLLNDGHTVTVLDNLSSGKTTLLDGHMSNSRFTFTQGDLINISDIEGAVKGRELVLYVGGNSDIRAGATDTRLHIDNNILGIPITTVWS